MNPILHIKHLNLAFKQEKNDNQVLFDINFKLMQGEILGIVGESGSGKSVANLAILGLLNKAKTVVSGKAFFESEQGKLDLFAQDKKTLQQIRGKEIAMIFQEPMTALNPSLTCGYQVAEVLLKHHICSKATVKQQVLHLFEQVKLPRATRMYNQYPHQLSGGQQQRVMIAMAIACKPKILIADEPTTALDVTVQKEIVALLKELQQETGMSIIFISHDLALVSEIANRILVLYKGKIIEEGDATTIFHNAQEPYTKALINARPSLEKRLKKLPTVQDFLTNALDKILVSNAERDLKHQEIYSKKPLLEIKNISKYFGTKKQLVKAVNDVSFQVYQGETLGLVGESGCGKSTLGRTILQLDKATKGAVFYNGEDITKLDKKSLRKLRKEIQIIFQDPYSSLNPRMMVGEAILEPMEVHKMYKNKAERKAMVLEILQKVGLEESHYYRYPHEFSGGQRQRIGIARTIALQPKLIICDESVSALDVSVQAQVLNLLNQLKEDFGFTYIFISHDLAVVKYMADQLLVMNKGKIEEIGDADTIYKEPKSDYTKELINAIPKGI
jgi:peptide/nickel transport system ATP-binding protein